MDVSKILDGAGLTPDIPLGGGDVITIPGRSLSSQHSRQSFYAGDAITARRRQEPAKAVPNPNYLDDILRKFKPANPPSK